MQSSSAASQSDCRLLLSEDFQEGFTWAGVTVVDPFSSPQHAPVAFTGPMSSSLYREPAADIMLDLLR
jgi:hypothetical protein